MAPILPAKLKSADIQRFATRASQLETAKPAIAYWCEYWIVNQLLARGLHSADAECLQYTTNLMDKLEQTKLKYADDAAVVDDTAGQEAVLKFGMETFERADKAVQANRVTKQTADTFLAASTFLELLNIWGDPPQEAHAKIRYAKWNAVRIVKAIKDGNDPNESNPAPEPEAEPDLEPLDPNDPEVQALGGVSDSLQPTVEEVPDEQDRIQSHLSAQSTHDYSLHPSQQVSAQASPGPSPLPHGEHYPIGTDTDVSPLEESPNPRNGSVGGGYFPEVPTGTRSPTLPSAPADIVSPPSPDITEPNQLPPPVTAPSADIQDFYRQDPAPPTVPAPQFSPPPPSQPQTFSPPSAPTNPQPPIFMAPPTPSSQAPLLPAFTTPVAQAIPRPQSSMPPPAPVQPPASKKEVYITDDAAVAKAQKHARWAISALNFEDADTAVKELREALKTLGAS